MFGKKKQVVTTIYDNQYERMWNDLLDANTTLSNRARTSYVRNACIAVYPDGPDRDKALTDSFDAKYSLLCAIGTYDSLLNEVRAFYKKHKNDLDKCVAWNPERYHDSHKIIEITIENLMRRA